MDRLKRHKGADLFTIVKEVEVQDVGVRPLSSKSDYERVVDYFLTSSESFLHGMGIDPDKLPERETWLKKLLADSARDYRDKETCYVGWMYRGEPIGHSNINRLTFGEQANIHLHIWVPHLRNGGLGTRFLRKSARYFFETFELKRLLCEPWVENPAPNRTLRKAGFRYVGRYRTVPGPINSEQDVNRYEMSRATPFKRKSVTR